MKILVLMFLCSIQYIPLEGLQLAPYLPSLAPASERAKFLQVAAARGDAALIGFIHKNDPLAWASGDGWRLAHGTTALHAAAESRDALAVRALIALGANLSAVDSQRRSPLHITARSDAALGATIELLDAGAEVDATTLAGVTPLMEAVRYNAPRTVNALLHAGADRARAPDGGPSVAVQALQNNPHPPTAATILGARYVPQPEYKTCAEWRIDSLFMGPFGSDTTDSLLRNNLHKHISVYVTNSSPMLNASDLFHRTPLHTAVARNDWEGVKKLLTLGADTEAVDWLKRTPLQLAKLCQFSNIEKLLHSHAGGGRHNKLGGNTKLIDL